MVQNMAQTIYEAFFYVKSRVKPDIIEKTSMDEKDS